MSEIAPAAAKTLMAEYAAAVLAKAPRRLEALYRQDARVFDAWGVWSFEGRESWGRNLREWLGSLDNERAEVSFEDVRCELGPAIGWLSATVIYAAVDPSGRPLRSMENRLSWVLALADDGWAIAHEHTSAPIDFTTQKAMLKRT